MAYGVKYRLNYCNKDGDEFRLDIEVDGYSGEIFPIEGTPSAFVLSQYNSNRLPKLETIRSTSAEIEIYEDDNFNLNALLTSSETKIRVSHYINSNINWRGFVLPEFFRTEISGIRVVNMTATDRIGVLKNIPVDKIYGYISILDLVQSFLSKTGLALNIKTIIGFSERSPSSPRPLITNVMGERLFSQKGSSLSCYDALKSILDMFNCFITQKNGFWWIVNKEQQETGSGTVVEYSNVVGDRDTVSIEPFSRPTISIDEVYSGGEQLVQPTLSSAAILGEIGGSKIYPDNNNFRSWTSPNFAYWTPKKGFAVANYTDIATEYNANGSIDRTSDFDGFVNKLLNSNQLIYPTNVSQNTHPNNYPYLESAPTDILPLVGGSEDISLDFNFNVTGKHGFFPMFSIVLETSRPSNRYYTYSNRKGQWIEGGNDINNLYNNHAAGSNIPFFVLAEGHWGLIFRSIDNADNPDKATTVDISGTAVIPIDILSGLEYCRVIVRIMPTIWSGEGQSSPNVELIVNSTQFSIANNNVDQKGNLYRVDRPGDYSTTSDIPTAVYSDYIFGGINGYFYDYPIDDVSAVTPIGSTSWRTDLDPTYAPLLLHVARQMSNLYSDPHKDLHVTIDVRDVDPLSLFSIDCHNEQYIVTKYDINYFTGECNILLSEVKRAGLSGTVDYIYSYFGDEAGTSVSGLSSISGGSGGGGSAPQNLQSVTEVGNTTPLDISVRGVRVSDFIEAPTSPPDPADVEVGKKYFWIS